jgi:hypothetical protein
MAPKRKATEAQKKEPKFPDTPEGWQARWQVELSASRERLKKWHEQGDKTVKFFLDERDAGDEMEERLGLFTANTQTMEALLYGKTPQADVTRKFSDADDDVARVSAEILKRLLNADIERECDGFSSSLQDALQERLQPGMGSVRLRYVAEFGQEQTVDAQVDETGRELAPAYVTTPKVHEDVETVFESWKNQLWGAGKRFQDVGWWAFKAELSQEKLVEKFGEIGRTIPLNTKKSGSEDLKKSDPWERADVWEIWDKEHKKCWWVVEGFTRVLTPVELQANENGSIDDPLELEGFWPFPRPMVANVTTSKFVPKPDFIMAQDLYVRVNRLYDRISMLQDALKVAGLYDDSVGDLQQLLDSDTGNKLYPVKRWAMFAEKGGINGAIDWFPLDMIVGALDKLTAKLNDTIALLYQVTGMSDIMRGQAAVAATATEQAIKAKFASVRVQRFQDEFARFASDAQKIRAEIICSQFDENTILERSNIMQTPDKVFAPDAVKLLKSKFYNYRVQVKPEAISLTDYAALKQERTEVIAAIGGYLQVAGPLAMQSPALGPSLLQILQWLVSGLKGASGIESILDQAVQQAKQAAAMASQQPQQEKPDPRMMTEQFKAKAQMVHAQQAHAQDMQRIQAETQADIVKHQAQAVTNVREAEATERIKGLHALNNVIPNGAPQ